ncbi:MAG: hypothetical protein WC009_08770 [Methylotenera sp.]
MTQVSALDHSIINSLQSHLTIFSYTDSELNALALGVLEGLKLAGASAPLLELSVLSGNVKRMLAGELSGLDSTDADLNTLLI